MKGHNTEEVALIDGMIDLELDSRPYGRNAPTP
jgi:hypothetical protein